MFNLGGGLGVAYTEFDHPPSIEEYVAFKVDAVDADRRAGEADPRRARPRARRQRRPSRSTPSSRSSATSSTYVAVDGGMSDNLRPMLYGARYEAQVVGAARAAGPAATSSASTASPATCSIHDADLADPRPGDVIVTPATGAYGFAMANNYNGLPRAPVVFVLGRRRAGRRAPRDLRGPHGPRCLTRSRSGSACSATAPSARAFATLLAERADEIARDDRRCGRSSSAC